MIQRDEQKHKRNQQFEEKEVKNPLAVTQFNRMQKLWKKD